MRPSKPGHFRVGTVVTTPTPSLLQPSDFTYLGHYDVLTPLIPNLSQGLSHRYVSGDLRLLTLHGSDLREFSLAGKAFGQTVTAVTRSWPNIGGFGVSSSFKAIWWDEAAQRLWTTGGRVVNSGAAIPTQIYTRTLLNNGTISNLHGPVSLSGIPDRRAFGGAQPVPAAFQALYGTGPYVVGWGGGTSTIMGGGMASLGPSAYAMPDPAGFADGATIPAGSVDLLADFTPPDTVRGVRVSLPINYLDGGLTSANPSTPPNYPPIAGARFQSPRADGKGWWTPCDSHWNTGNWIDTATKYGFVTILSGFSGKVYYMSSNVWCDYMEFELHIFDPARFGEVATGLRTPYSVEPASMTLLTLPGLSNKGPKTNMTPGMGVSGATYDATGKRLYLFGAGINNFSTTNRLFVYAVNA